MIMEGTWDDLIPTISFCGEVKHSDFSILSKDSWMELLVFQFENGLSISEEIMKDALSSEDEDFGIYLQYDTEEIPEATGVTHQDILADALKSTFGDEDDLIFLGEEKPDTPYSQGSCYESPSPCSSTTSGVFSSHDYEALSPWSIGSPASPQIMNMEPRKPAPVAQQVSYQQSQQQWQHQQQQNFTCPNYNQSITSNRNHHLQRLSTPMQLTTVDPKLANWLSQQIPSSNDPRPVKKLTRPPESYVALIAKAILSLSSGRALLSDIYKYSTDNYEYYRTAPKTWKNAIRHNLSVNECFIKNGRAPHGRGYYWSVHPACLQSFMGGDFRRREAQQLANESDRIQLHQSSYGYHQYYPGPYC